jgi:hypothetical protein
MKKYLIFSIFCLIFQSCNFEDINEENEVDETKKTKKNLNNETLRQSNMFPYIESIHIDNGLENECKNNILIFPTWSDFNNTVEMLDKMTEIHCDQFDATLPADISEDLYNQKADDIGFDEDYIIKKFEDDLYFCSLRSKIDREETDWLDQQGDGEWDLESDPDNDFIDDETERALLSYGHEVIIGTRDKGYKIYKLNDANGNFYEILNMDTNAISQINTGNTNLNNPNVIKYIPSPKPETCKGKVFESKIEENGEYRIKRKSIIRHPFGTNNNNNSNILPGKIKAKTVGYKKVRGRWKKRRTWITAGINGEDSNTDGYTFANCTTQSNGLRKVKTKCRRKVKVKFTSLTYNDPLQLPNQNVINLKNNKVFSFHAQGGVLNVNIDYYDMPEN